MREKHAAADAVAGTPVVPRGPEPVTPAEPGSPEAKRRSAWAQVLKNVFEVDPLVCPKCGGEMKGIAWNTDRAVIDRILAHRPNCRGAEAGLAAPFEARGLSPPGGAAPHRGAQGPRVVPTARETGEIRAEGAWTRTVGGGGGGNGLRERGERGVGRVASGPRSLPSALAPSREGARARRMALGAAARHPPGGLNSLCSLCASLVAIDLGLRFGAGWVAWTLFDPSRDVGWTPHRPVGRAVQLLLCAGVATAAWVGPDRCGTVARGVARWFDRWFRASRPRPDVTP